MTKSELVRKLAEANPRLHHHYVEVTVTLIFEQITAALARGDRVELRGFGAFSVKRRGVPAVRGVAVEPLESTDAPRPKSFKKRKRLFASSWLRRILRQRRCSGQGAGQAQCGRTRPQKECWPLTRGSSA